MLQLSSTRGSRCHGVNILHTGVLEPPLKMLNYIKSVFVSRWIYLCQHTAWTLTTYPIIPEPETVTSGSGRLRWQYPACATCADPSCATLSPHTRSSRCPSPRGSSSTSPTGTFRTTWRPTASLQRTMTGMAESMQCCTSTASDSY